MTSSGLPLDQSRRPGNDRTTAQSERLAYLADAKSSYLVIRKSDSILQLFNLQLKLTS
jgi:hypothetical protein